MRARLRSAVVALVLPVAAVEAQSPAKPPATGWEFVGLPALNFTTDEGLGYGVLLEVYNYGSGVQPYRFTIQPTVFLTTKGRRDVVLFFDAPHVLKGGWRVDALAAVEQQLATPYYGLGNSSAFDTTADEPPNPYFYRYGKRQVRLAANLQHRIASLPARFLLGVGFADVRTDATPFDSGTTLLNQQLGAAGAAAPRGRISFARAGLVWDTRDREIGPRSGSWSELLVQRSEGALGATHSFTRVTAAARKYFPLGSRIVFAQRLLAQQTGGNVPLFEMATIPTSYKQQEGLGGSNTVRGLPKNRFIGKSMVMSNSELRWRAGDFRLIRKPAYIVLSGFVDAGRVWNEGIRAGEIASDLHAGYGAGFRIGLGPSFVAAFDVGRSSESTQIYIGLGYPF